MPRMPRHCGAGCGALSFLGHGLKRSHRDRHPLFAFGNLQPDLGGLPTRRRFGPSQTSTPIPHARIELVAGRARSARQCRPLCACSARTCSASSGVRHIIGCVTSWSRKEVIPVLEKVGGDALVCLPLRRLRGERACRLHARLPEPASGAAARPCRAALRRQRLSARLQLHLGLGDQPRRPRPDRRRRRQRFSASAICRSARPTCRG